ncbi:hypothetical protein BEWA_046480 [Theileria equi strain WA]|uniref:Uncharacterized protein n=1 Tax=Theileria equi strain WA TaxID=1537102 RepID=L1LA95_THEEQ|nr:hypothetical protein BEWA_046480 [Theileria equi strain WA]EKX72184.1 hypothetical protein BEWA_046480 [Theileria equi strain WA]|eukprot:XP_004831636.1 hypothetical protein BEWA_046480 [Theileria equi strain WA]
MSRYVLVYNRDDGTKYVRIATRKRIARNYFCRIDEFIKRGTDFEYTKIERIPVTLGLPIEANNNDITVNFIPDERYPERFNKEYTVKDEMKDYLVIGTVMYGDMILDEKTDGLINRTVTWEGGAGRPKIVVSSRYQDGMETDIKYAFIDGNLDKFYIWDARKRLMNLYE